MRFTVAAVLLLALVASPGTAAQAQVLLSTGAGNSSTHRYAGDGPGQGVQVSTDTNLTQFGFWVGAPQAVNLKFMIWSGDNSQELFSSILSVGPTADHTLTMSDPFSFALAAGQTYFFGIMADGEVNVDYFSPPLMSSQNGLSLVGTNSNYLGYDNPAFRGYAGASIALQLNGTQGTTVTPEPVSTVLLGTGLAGVIGAARRRRQRAEA